jgi:hypothetical protein
MAESEESKHSLLSAHLSFAVPFAIAEIRECGGPTEADREFVAAFAQTLGEKGDVLLYGGKKGEAGTLVSQLARALAVLAYQPGGVSVFGLHFEEKPWRREPTKCTPRAAPRSSAPNRA